MISFKGAHFAREAILYAICFYIRCPVTYRDLQEITCDRGVDVDHATLNRWVVKISTMIAESAQQKKRSTGSSWRMDETCFKVKGKWVYFYRAIDTFGKTLDFMLSEGVSNSDGFRKPSVG